MARVYTGNYLSTPEIQPGWTIATDGFGLVTATVTYKMDQSVDPAPYIARGTAFTDPAYTYLKAHKGTVSYDNLKYATMKIDYVGIDPTFNNGNMTDPNCGSANGLTGENITAHPNFFEHAGSPYLGPIAGPAPYTQDAPNNLAPNVNGQPAYLGLNGSCFEKANGGRFIGFVDPTYPQYYGKTQYLAPTTSYSGIIYVDDSSSVQVLVELLGTTTLTRSWSTFPLLPAWAPQGSGMYGNPVNLLSQINTEEYGSLFKISYEIRYSRVGWEIDVYKKN